MLISSVIADNGKTLHCIKHCVRMLFKDNSGLSIGDASVSPTLLTQSSRQRGPTTINLYDFSNTPTGAVAIS